MENIEFMIRRTFSPDDAWSIMSIPLSSRLPPDRIIWAYTSKGNFTVRSAYKIALSSSSDQRPDNSSRESRNSFWKNLWRLNVPNKIKSFAWRASRNILPTKENLCHRKVLNDPICEACGIGVESGGHLFWSCDRAQEVWKLSGIPFDNRGVQFRDFIDLLWYLQFFQRLGNELLELVITVAWSMWFNRNAVRQGKARQLAATILQKARLLLDEFQLANFQPSRSVLYDRGQWTTPSMPWYKINIIDGAVFESQQASGVGVIIKDHGGLVAPALSKKVVCPLGPLEAEAKVLEEAVDFAWDVGIRDAHFECDSKMVVDAMLGVSCPQASIYNIIIGIGQKVQAFRSFQFSHVKRTGNRPAHILAQHAKNIDNYVTWIEENPVFVESALAQDVLFLSSS